MQKSKLNFKPKLKSIVCGITAFLICFSCAGCAEKTENTEFPVKYFNVEEEKAPNGVVSMSETVSQSIVYLGYGDRMITGDFGDSITPNTDNIIAANPDLLFTCTALSDANTKKLNDAGIKIALVTLPKNLEELSDYYIGICSLIGGNITGKSVAETFNKDIKESFTNIKKFVNDNNKNLNAVIYLEENYAAIPDTFISNIFSLAGINNLNNGTDYYLNAERLALLNPDVIICGEDVGAKLLANESLKDLNAVKNKLILTGDIKQINNLGKGFLDNIYGILQKAYPDFIS